MTEDQKIKLHQACRARLEKRVKKRGPRQYDRNGYVRNHTVRLEQQRAYRATHLEQERERNRKYYRDNPEKVRARAARRRPAAMARRREWEYGLTPRQYAQMVDDQHGVCAICLRLFEDTPRVDHDHVSGKVRGLLCNACNTMLGFAKDSETTLLAAVEYLRRNKN